MRTTHVLTLTLLAVGLTGCRKKPIAPVKTSPHPLVVEAQNHFTYKGKPIPPFFLADFCGGPDGGDFWTKGMGARISAVAVEGLFYEHGAGSYSGCTIEQSKDFVRFDLPTRSGEAAPSGGWFSYKFLGTTLSGITVLEYVGNTGGSGIVPGVVFLRFEVETVGYTEAGKQERLIMRFLGQQSWGDRVYREAELVGNELRLGPERSHMPGGPLDPARTILLE